MRIAKYIWVSAKAILRPSLSHDNSRLDKSWRAYIAYIAGRLAL